MAAVEVLRHDEGDRRQRPGGDVGVKRRQPGQAGLEAGAALDLARGDERIADGVVLRTLRNRHRHAERGCVGRDIGRFAAARVPLPGHALGGKRLGDRRHRLRRQGVVVRPERLGVAGDVVAEAVVVDEVVLADVAVALDALAGEVRGDGADARLRRVGAVHVGSAAVAVLGVEVRRLGHRVRVLDLVERRHRRCSAGVEVAQVGRRDGEEIRAGAAHDRLVVVVADGVLSGETLEDRCVAAVAMLAKPISSPPCDGFAGVTPDVSPPCPAVTATQVCMSSLLLSPPVCCHIWKKRCTGSPVRLPSGLETLSA